MKSFKEIIEGAEDSNTGEDYSGIEGYAYTKDEKAEAERRYKRYQEIKDIPIKITDQKVSYAHRTYWGVIPDGVEISNRDIAIWCDRGNTCFGGSVSRKGQNFVCTIYTD